MGVLVAVVGAAPTGVGAAKGLSIQRIEQLLQAFVVGGEG